jgi:DNA repair/transcription protein MET18/MMS19
MVAGLHDSMCCLRDACGSEAQQVNLHPDGEDTLDWAREVKKVTAGAEIPSEWLRLLHSHYPDIHDQIWPNTVEDAQAIATSTETQAPGSSSQDVFADFIRLSLFIVRHFFRRVTKEIHDSEGKLVLHLADEIADYSEKRRRAILEHVERMAPMTIKALDARSQQFYKLPTEAFRLFSNCKITAPYWSVAEDGALNLLTLSILKGLWPDAMTDLVSFTAIGR